MKACTGLALWPFQSDQISVSRFASQVFGDQRKLFLKAYAHVCDRLPRGGYLYVHLRHESGKPWRSLRNFLTVPLTWPSEPGPVFDQDKAFVYELSDPGGSTPFQAQGDQLGRFPIEEQSEDIGGGADEDEGQDLGADQEGGDQ